MLQPARQSLEPRTAIKTRRNYVSNRCPLILNQIVDPLLSLNAAITQLSISRHRFSAVHAANRRPTALHLPRGVMSERRSRSFLRFTALR
jgi:hypothetical protein